MSDRFLVGLGDMLLHICARANTVKAIVKSCQATVCVTGVRSPYCANVAGDGLTKTRLDQSVKMPLALKERMDWSASVSKPCLWIPRLSAAQLPPCRQKQGPCKSSLKGFLGRSQLVWRFFSEGGEGCSSVSAARTFVLSPQTARRRNANPM